MSSPKVKMILLLVVVINGLTHDRSVNFDHEGVALSKVKGSLEGIPFEWKDESVGKLVRISGRVSDGINSIQFHYEGGKSSPKFGGDGNEGVPDEVNIPEGKELAQIIFRKDDQNMYTLDFTTYDGWRDRFGNSTQVQDNEHYVEMNGGTVVGFKGAFTPDGYLNGLAVYFKDKIHSVGRAAGRPFAWRGSDLGDLV